MAHLTYEAGLYGSTDPLPAIAKLIVRITGVSSCISFKRRDVRLIKRTLGELPRAQHAHVHLFPSDKPATLRALFPETA